MKEFILGAKRATLRRIFNRRLLILLVTFSVVMGGVIMLAYQNQTDRLNHAAMNSLLAHLKARIQNQQVTQESEAEHFLSIIEWSGILNLPEPQRSMKLNAFFTAQSASMGFDGLVLSDSAGRMLFDYWGNSEKPAMAAVLADTQPLWLDSEHDKLYHKIHKVARANSVALNVFFFKAWDSAALNRLTFADTSTYLTLGSHPLLSSAGNLALEAIQPSNTSYRVYRVNDIDYQEGSTLLAEIANSTGEKFPLKLVVRSPIKNAMPMRLLLASFVGVTLLFGALLFIVLGRWMGRMGARLDGLASATLQFENSTVHGVTEETSRLLESADDDKRDQISVVAQELSALMKSSAARDEEQRAYLQTLDLLQDAVIEFTPSGHMLRATDAWKSLTGLDDINSYRVTDCVHPDDCDEVKEQISALVHHQKQQINIRFRMRRQEEISAHYWVEGRFAAVKKNDQVTSIRGVVRDITSTYKQERQISHMALHDALTDLPNRVLLEDRMEMAISRAARSNQRVALGFIDLDHFKQVNDNFGHKIGDRLLKEVTQRLQTALRATDTLSRWGGDEFVVLCPDLNSLDDARELTLKLALLTRDNISIDGTDFPFTFSAGFAVYPDDASNSEMLLAQADRAMFYAKAQGRNNIQFFNAIAGKEVGRQSFYIQSRLTTAIHQNQIQAWMQPLISAHTGKVIGAEVLARWNEPEQGWIPPSVFIPMAESLGLIDKLGQSVWQQALQSFSQLPPDHRLSVNLSKRQLFSGTIVQQFCDDIERAHIKPDRIMLEVTEGIALSDVEFAHERIAELDAKGFGIAVDDFGVGYSSLSQLHEIPADELNLDISFVKRINKKDGFSIASAIIAIARSLEMEIVAEGVEDEATLKLLTEMGVDILQGYYFAKPMPIPDYIAWLRARGEA